MCDLALGAACGGVSPMVDRCPCDTLVLHPTQVFFFFFFSPAQSELSEGTRKEMARLARAIEKNDPDATLDPRLANLVGGSLLGMLDDGDGQTTTLASTTSAGVTATRTSAEEAQEEVTGQVCRGF